MRTLLKVLGILVLVAVLALAGLAIFVRFYLTDERLQAILIPRAEEALGRQVTLEKVDVSLFRGIELQNFIVKSADAQQDFLRVDNFILSYQFWPLVKERRLVVSEILLEKPFVLVQRLADGTFNFESLALLQEPAKAEQLEKEAGPAALPIALTIDRIAIEQGRVEVRDALGEIPPTEAVIDGAISVAMGTDPASLRYQGEFEVGADISAGELNPSLSGTTTFDQETISYALEVAMAEQQLMFEGTTSGWPEKPEAVADLTSDRLDLDRLLGAMQALSQVGTAPQTDDAPQSSPPASNAGAAAREADGGSQAATGPISDSLPPGFTGSGQIRIKEALYQGLEMTDLRADYLLKNGILTIEDLSARTADGAISGELRADLTNPSLAYQGEIKAEGLQAKQLLSSLFPRTQGLLSGLLGSGIKFSGSGTEWETIRKTLSAEADYLVADGQLQEMEITNAIAALLDLPELRSIAFKKLDGSLRVQEGRVLLDTGLSSKNLQAKAGGFVGLTGELQVPLELQLTGALAEKARQQTSLVKYLTDQEGRIVLHLKLTGDISNPKPTLDTSAVRQRLEEKAKGTIEEKLRRELERTLQRKEQESAPPGGTEQPSEPEQGRSPAENLLDSIFGK